MHDIHNYTNMHSYLLLGARNYSNCSFFGTPQFQQFFFSPADDSIISESYDEIHGAEVSNLASKFDEVCNVTPDDPPEIDLDEFEGMRVVDLKEALEECGVEKRQYRGFRKAELKELLMEERRKQYQQISETEDTRSGPSAASQNQNDSSWSLFEQEKNNTEVILLILDESLHRIPWESFPFLSVKTVCRLPSLPFAVAPLLNQKRKFPIVNPNDTSFVLDPEANLKVTRTTLQPIFESIQNRHSWNWDGVVGEMPNESFFENALEKSDSLLLYCGHGGGYKCFGRSQIESLRTCQSSIILMGCSSGRLNANEDKMECTGSLSSFYEPDGIVTSYLIAGAPCVVGNLWDVTDRDIDRYVSDLFM